MKEEINTSNNKNEKYFFFFTPTKVSPEVCCCLTLKNGVKLLSLFFLLSAGSNFIESVSYDSLILGIISIFECVLHLLSAIYLFIGSINLNYSYAKVAYTTYEILVSISIISYSLVLVLIIFGIYIPDNYQEKDMVIILLAFFFVMTIVLFFYFYFLWIIFSFMVMLGEGNLSVVIGEELIKIMKREENEYQQLLETAEEKIINEEENIINEDS